MNNLLRILWLAIVCAATTALPLQAQEQAKTVEQLRTELLTRMNHTLLSPHYQWQNDGFWIKRSQVPMAYARMSPEETSWKLRDGRMSRVHYTTGTEPIFLQEGDSLYTVGQIIRDFDYWNIYLGSTLIGQVNFDGRIRDGRQHPCGHILPPVTDEMAVYLFFVYAIPDPFQKKK
jgi:hypothetical protein